MDKVDVATPIYNKNLRASTNAKWIPIFIVFFISKWNAAVIVVR